MILAKCKGIRYVEGDHTTVRGIKRSEKGYRFGTISFRNRGTGYGEIKTSSQLLVQIEYSNHNIEVSIGDFFKKNLKRLTKKRRNAIEKTMPKGIKIESVGGLPFEAVESELDDWLIRAKKLL